MTERPYADWTTEALKEYEERLYDRELEGEDVWFERDQVVLWELNRRDFGELKPSASHPE
jgi:hypothetical protein